MKRLWVVWLALLWVCWLWGGVALAQGGGNAYLGQDVYIHSGEVVEGDMSLLGGRVVFEKDSLVRGNVAVMAGEVLVNGHIEGNLVAFGGVVDLGATAVVEGDVVALGTVRRHPDAQVHGRLVMGLGAARSMGMFARPHAEGRLSVERLFPAVGTWAGAVLRILAIVIALIGTALVLAVLLPGNLNNIARVMISHLPLTVGVGLLTFVLLIFLVPILVVLCIGIPVAIVLLLAVGVGALVGWVAAGTLLGERLLHVFRVGTTHPAIAAGLGVGLMTLFAQVPCVGWLLGLFIASWGLGSVILTRFGFGETAFWPPERSTRIPPLEEEPPQASTEAKVENRETRSLDESSLPFPRE